MKNKKVRINPRSLKVSDAFRSFVLDQLEELGDVTPRSMFGGVGLYCAGNFFGIIARDVLYLKVDDSTRGEYERAGMRPFRPYPDRSGTMQYYAVPVAVLESSMDLAAWARKAVAVANRQATREASKSTPPHKTTRMKRSLKAQGRRRG